MVNTVVANVVRPTVATDDPLRRLDELVPVHVNLLGQNALVLRSLQHREDLLVEALALDGVVFFSRATP